MQNTEYADSSWEKCTLHVQPKPWRHFCLKDKKKKRSAKDRFIPIPAKLIWKIKDRMRERNAQPHNLVFPNARKDDPNTIVLFEVYQSQAAQDFHLQQDFTKKS